MAPIPHGVGAFYLGACMSCGAETEAGVLLTTLLDGVPVTVPSADLNASAYKLPASTDIRLPVKRLLNSDLTTGEVAGTGTFDVLMASVSKHLMAEYEANRISGAEYTKTYAALVSAAMSTATQFLLQKEQTYWQNQLAQVNALTASIQLELARTEYGNKQVEFALMKLKLVSESNASCLTKNELEIMRPLQQAGLVAQNANLATQNVLLREQAEAQRAQTSDVRIDGGVVGGSVGKQKALYTQQITSYQRDAEVKAAKLFTDAWITQKTIDEGLLPPDGFNNASVNSILSILKTNNSLA